MTTIFNLDLSKKNEPASFAYNIPTNSTYTMYFRVSENEYVIDYSKFQSLSLRFQFEDNSIEVKSATTMTTYKGEKVVKYDIPPSFLKNTTKIYVTPTVKVSNKTTVLSSFKLIIYDGSSTEMNGILSAIDQYNYMLGQFYDSIKRVEINKPNGVIGLDNKGKLDINLFPNNLLDHLPFEIRQGEVHGLKFDSKHRLIYYDDDDQRWYVANQIHGGSFKNPNKDASWNIHGGFFDDGFIDAATFADNITDYISGGEFTDSLADEWDAGSFLDAGYLPTGQDKAIHGGTF